MEDTSTTRVWTTYMRMYICEISKRWCETTTRWYAVKYKVCEIQTPRASRESPLCRRLMRLWCDTYNRGMFFYKHIHIYINMLLCMYVPVLRTSSVCYMRACSAHTLFDLQAAFLWVNTFTRRSRSRLVFVSVVAADADLSPRAKHIAIRCFTYTHTHIWADMLCCVDDVSMWRGYIYINIYVYITCDKVSYLVTHLYERCKRRRCRWHFMSILYRQTDFDCANRGRNNARAMLMIVAILRQVCSHRFEDLDLNDVHGSTKSDRMTSS